MRPSAPFRRRAGEVGVYTLYSSSNILCCCPKFSRYSHCHTTLFLTMVVEGSSDPVIARLIADDHTPWYKKRNLRLLYLTLVPCCLAIESTSGFDSSLMNGLQSLDYWQEFYGEPVGPQLGILTASYNLGSLTALPFVTILSDHVGRRWSIMFGSLAMVVGAVMQAFSVNCKIF